MNQKLAEARILASRKMPYMTHQVMTLIPVERPGLGTMAVDEQKTGNRGEGRGTSDGQ